MQDLGYAARYAKQEGVIEVVELDNGQDKVLLSHGSPFSEISVKDEEETEEKQEDEDVQE